METPAGRNGGYSTREADLNLDAASIVSLWADNLLGHDQASARAKLRLGYRDNPAGGASVQLLMVQGEPHAQGAQGLHARVFWVGARQWHGAGLGDFVVNLPHRSLWPALLLMRRCVKLGAERFDVTYGFPNKKAAAVCRQGGLRQFGDMQRYAKPLSSRAYLARRMPSWMAGVVAPMVDAAMRIGDSFRALLGPTPLACTAIDWQDPAIDMLWSRRVATVAFSERSSRMLQWRFALPGRGKWHLCLVSDASGSAQGYVVWRDLEGLVEIGDFFTVEPARCTASLLNAFIRMARTQGARSVSLEFFGANQVVAQILRAGMRQRPERHPVYTCSVLPEGFGTPGNWYLTLFDDDAD